MGAEKGCEKLSPVFSKIFGHVDEHVFHVCGGGAQKSLADAADRFFSFEIAPSQASGREK